MIKIIFIVTLGLFVACFGKQKEEPTTGSVKAKKEIPVLDLAKVIDKEVPDTFTWNSIAQKTSLLPISTTSNALIGAAPQLVYIAENNYIISDAQTNTIYRIATDGKILKSFNHVGKGPGEYIYCSYIYVNPSTLSIQVFDNGSQKRITYDPDGQFIKEISLIGKETNLPAFITDTYAIMRGSVESSCQYYITDPELNIRQRFFPIDTSLSTWEKSALYLQTNRSICEDKVIVNHPSKDSVFTLSEQGIEPLFILKKGSFAIPEEEIKNFMQLSKKGDPHILSLRIGSIPGYYLISYVRNKQFVEEIWSKENNQIISRFIAHDEQNGFPFTFPSGKTIRINNSSLYTKGNKIVLFIPSYLASGEIPGVKEDDNPVLLTLEL